MLVGQEGSDARALEGPHNVQVVGVGRIEVVFAHEVVIGVVGDQNSLVSPRAHLLHAFHVFFQLRLHLLGDFALRVMAERGGIKVGRGVSRKV